MSFGKKFLICPILPPMSDLTPFYANAQGKITWKRFILERHLFQVIFWHAHQQYVCLFAALYLPQDGGGKLLCNDARGDPLQALLEGALGQQAACQLWFHFQEEIKGRWCEICEKWSWENIFTPFSTASYWKKRRRWLFGCWPSKKQVLYRHAWSFKPKNHYKSLLGPYEG